MRTPAAHDEGVGENLAHFGQPFLGGGTGIVLADAIFIAEPPLGGILFHLVAVGFETCGRGRHGLRAGQHLHGITQRPGGLFGGIPGLGRFPRFRFLRPGLARSLLRLPFFRGDGLRGRRIGCLVLLRRAHGLLPDDDLRFGLFTGLRGCCGLLFGAARFEHIGRIIPHAFVNRAGDLVLPLFRFHIGHLLGVGHETDLGQHARHVGGIEHAQQLGLDAPRMAPSLQVIILNTARQRHAVLAVGELQVLDIGPHDGRRPLVRHVDQVFAVVLEQGVLIVTLLLGAFAHDERLDTPCRRGFRSIDVDRNEEVAAGLVGDVGTRLEVGCQIGAQRLVRLAGIDHLHARHPLLDELPEFERHLQREVFLVDIAVVRPGEFPAVSGIDDHNFDPVRNIPGRGTVH